jgi:hypothetical protein
MSQQSSSLDVGAPKQRNIADARIQPTVQHQKKLDLVGLDARLEQR